MAVKSKRKVSTLKGAKYNDRLMIFGIVAILLLIVAVSLTFINNPNNVSSCSNKLMINVKYNCYLNYALKNDNITICNQLTYPYSSECILNTAINYSNVNDCKIITNDSIKYDCISTISLSENKPVYCNYLNGSAYDQCIYNNVKAENFTNDLLCNNITNLSQKNICSSVYYFKLTYKSGDNYCGYITNKPNYSILYNMVYFTNQSLISINNAYEYTYYNVTPYAYCISYIAYKSNNLNLCSTLNNTNSTLCKNSFVTKANSNTSITSLKNDCLNQNATLKDICLYSIEIYNATQNKNVSECMQINSTIYQYSCISDIAKIYNSSNYCSYIKNSSARYSCNLTTGNYS